MHFWSVCASFLVQTFLTLDTHAPEGYGSCPVCLCVCPQELICRLVLVDVELKALTAWVVHFHKNVMRFSLKLLLRKLEALWLICGLALVHT